jgi:hypothetical protein
MTAKKMPSWLRFPRRHFFWRACERGSFLKLSVLVEIKQKPRAEAPVGGEGKNL